MTLNWDPVGKVVLELRQDADVAAIAGANPTDSRIRVRGFEPAPTTDSYAGDAHGPGSYRAFVVVSHIGGSRFKRVPVQKPRLLVRCYGRTKEEAAALGVAASDALHYQGPRVHSNGLGIYSSFNDSGGDQDKDPDTSQPYVDLFIDLLATTQAVAS
jgi:hypothetical protein